MLQKKFRNDIVKIMQYSYQNQGYNEEGDNKEKEAEIKARRHRMQSSLLIMESDFNRGERKAEDIKLEITQLERKMDQIKASVEDKNEELKKMNREQAALEENIARLKKKLKAL